MADYQTICMIVVCWLVCLVLSFAYLNWRKTQMNKQNFRYKKLSGYAHGLASPCRPGCGMGIDASATAPSTRVPSVPPTRGASVTQSAVCLVVCYADCDTALVICLVE